MSLSEYKSKRNFNNTSEPAARKKRSGNQLRFVVQRHHASHLHYDFRLELNGVLKSWAVPKGPSLNPKDKRLAMMVEDHPIDYGSFEGVIPEGNYGAGVVSIFDEGNYEPLEGQTHSDLNKGLIEGNLKFRLNGKILKGEFALVKLKSSEDNSWLLIKHRDSFATDKKFDSEALVPTAVKERGKHHKELAKNARESSSDTFSDDLPEDFKPMDPVSSKEIPEGNEWLFERKFKGDRVLAFVGPTTRLTSQNVDRTAQFSDISSILSDSEVSAVLDGILVDDKNSDVDKNKSQPLSLNFYLFDLLALNGHDIRHLPLLKRKELLKTWIKNIDNPHIIFSEYVIGKGDSILKRAKTQGWKGLIAKEVESHYQSGKKAAVWKDIPFSVSDKKQHKKKPDKSASEAIEENNDVASLLFPDEKEEKSGKRTLKLTNLNKIYWPDESIKKGQLLDYYRGISDYILPYLKDRPLSLNRHPNGIKASGFFQKDLDTSKIPEWISYKTIRSESNNRDTDYLICNDLFTLLWMVNLGCIEINPWLSTYQKIEKPVFAVLDLDPNEVKDFDDVVSVALTARDILQELGVKPYIKTSGSRGLHIFIHMGQKYDYDLVRSFVHDVALKVNEKHPEITSLERSPSKRKNKIYLDYLQNSRGQTIVAPYSVRPKAGATVSTPLQWLEVKKGLDIKRFTLFTVMDRLKKKGDLWEDIFQEKADLKAARLTD